MGRVGMDGHGWGLVGVGRDEWDGWRLVLRRIVVAREMVLFSFQVHF
jgi:hypothetical protein